MPREISLRQVLLRLKKSAKPGWAKNSRARFGIIPANAIGIPVPRIRALAKEIGWNHGLALELWRSGVHEARILATMIDEPARVTKKQMEEWVNDFDSWDICDHACGNLFDKTPFAYEQALAWSKRNKEYIKRAGFALMAYLAVHDKRSPDRRFVKFFDAIRREASDDRNFVKKAVNWALREIGKRNLRLHSQALRLAQEIRALPFRSARWIAADAIRELTSEQVSARVSKPPAS